MATDPTITVVRIPLLARASARVTLGQAITNENSVVATISRNAGGATIITKQSSDGGIIVTDADAEIYFELSDADVLLLSANKVFHLLVKLLNTDAVVVYAMSVLLIPVTRYISETFTLTGVSALLSTKFLNTLALLGEAGGDGYLDGIATVAQTVGCSVQFGSDGPEEWELVAGNNATEAGAWLRPLDYNAISNQKVWRRKQ